MPTLPDTDGTGDTASLVLCGKLGGSNIVQSFLSGASAGVRETLSVVDDCDAHSKIRIVNALFWRFADKTAPYETSFGRQVLMRLPKSGGTLISTGLSPVTCATLRAARDRGAVSIHYSSDDPWNPRHRASWHLAALPLYDLVFTPRRRNMHDFVSLRCRDVRYLPFGYDPDLIPERESAGWGGPIPQALFVGGADEDRAGFFREFLAEGVGLSLVGGYWDRYDHLRGHWLGHLPPRDLFALTRAAAVNLILVRRANRDGHVMRSFEAGAIGGCLAVEDTDEHREIFGTDGQTVRYFRKPADAAALCRELVRNPAERARLAEAVKARIRGGKNTYCDRLTAMLSAARTLRAQQTELLRD